MNAVKDTEKEVEQQRIAVGIDTEQKNDADVEPKILKADLSPEEWMELQPRKAETTNLVGSVSKPNVPIVRKRKRDEKAEARVAGSHFLQPLASESQRKTGIDTIEPAQSGLAEERKNTVKSKKAIADKKIVELNLYVESDDDESVPPGEEGTRVITGKDVLCGRGGAVNAHRGNKRFRDIIDQHRRTYLASRKAMKPLMNRAVVRLIRQEGGRFLKCDNDGLWYEIGDFKAHEKVGGLFLVVLAIPLRCITQHALHVPALYRLDKRFDKGLLKCESCFSTRSFQSIKKYDRNKYDKRCNSSNGSNWMSYNSNSSSILKKYRTNSSDKRNYRWHSQGLVSELFLWWILPFLHW